MTLGTLLKQGREILQNAGIAEWDLDAWYLLEYVTGVSRSQYFLDPEREVPQEQEAAYRQMIDKRSTHIPLQHLTGEQEFMGLTFKVNEHVLIPRQDTEVLVEEALNYVRSGMDILDVCTGTSSTRTTTRATGDSTRMKIKKIILITITMNRKLVPQRA